MKPALKVAVFSPLSLVIVLIGIGTVTVLRIGRIFPFEDRDPNNSSYNMNKRIIDLGMANRGFASLSPDGSLVLIERGTGSVPGPAAHWLEIRDVASSQIRANVPLPIMPMSFTSRFEAKLESVYSPVQFCDHGKYILVYDGGVTFSILNAGTYAQKASITLQLAVDRSAEDPLETGIRPDVVLSSSCAADAAVAAVELDFGPFGTGVTKVFDLESGEQTGEIPGDVAFGRLMNIDVSPSGGAWRSWSRESRRAN
jgi:hypothetical protein